MRGFPGDTVVTNPPASAGDVGSIPGSRGSPKVGNDNHCSVLARKTPWAEELVGYSPRRCKESDTTEHTHTPTT